MIGKKLFLTLSVLFLGSSLIVAVICFFPDLKEQIHQKLFPPQRKILSQVRGDLSGKGDMFYVVKVLTSDTLSLEIYQIQAENGATQFLTRLVLQEKRDGHFNYKGNATNLALVDVDGDGGLDIVTSGFDENLVPRLHVYKYDLNSGGFHPVGPESVKLNEEISFN